MAQLPEDVDFDPESEEEPGFGVSCLSEPGAEEQCPCPLIGTDAVGSDAKSPAVEENGSEQLFNHAKVCNRSGHSARGH